VKILALDTETSGLSPERHAIVSLGLAVMENGEVLSSHEFRMGVWEKTEYDVKALQISGIAWEDIEVAPAPIAVYAAVHSWIEKNGARDLTIVSHNAAFDAVFISQWMFKCGVYDRSLRRFVAAHEIVKGPWACTRRMASDLGLENLKLDTVAGYFGLSRSGELHGALEDAVLAGQVFFELRKLAAEAA
jgi:DNA polymerase-3 subunit epsilon